MEIFAPILRAAVAASIPNSRKIGCYGIKPGVPVIPFGKKTGCYGTRPGVPVVPFSKKTGYYGIKPGTNIYGL